jgi:ribosomal-protein-alanine N-acetyltransferase
MSAIKIRRMTMSDLEDVVRIDQTSFSLPWSKNNFIFELNENKTSRCYVACVGNDEKIVGLLVMWLIVDEAHVATIAVDEDFRKMGVAETMLRHALFECVSDGAIEATLEVRTTNLNAQNLYAKLGFVVVAERPNYYSDTKEGALIMTLKDISSFE